MVAKFLRQFVSNQAQTTECFHGILQYTTIPREAAITDCEADSRASEKAFLKEGTAVSSPSSPPQGTGESVPRDRSAPTTLLEASIDFFSPDARA